MCTTIEKAQDVERLYSARYFSQLRFTDTANVLS